jgi:2-oxoisovalerate dehydrogenase E2 component (dihydrolipoyl transacylase)
MSVFKLPDLGEGLHDAEIIEWHVTAGDHVEAGQTLVSVETDKAVVDIPSPWAGTIARTHGDAEEHVNVGAPLVEFVDGDRPDAGALVGRLPADTHGSKTASVAAAPPGQARIKATPAVRAQARRLGIDLASVTATGAEGQVTAADLEGASQTPSPPGGPASEPLRGPRRAMARNMARAHAEIAAATVTNDAIVPNWTGQTDVTILLAKAVAAGVLAAPGLNAWFDGHALSRTLHDHVDIGIAMDTEDGLFVPVLRNVAGRGMDELRDDLNRFKTQIAARTISPDDLRGATIALSNFGTIGGRHAALVVMPPQVAILGAGAIAERVVAIGGEPAVRRVLPLSLTFDHRTVTGGEAARFLAACLEVLEENP